MASSTGSKITRETGQPETNVYGKCVSDELLSQFYTDVKQRIEKSSAWDNMSAKERYYVINTTKSKMDGTDGNALSYAIDAESYNWVQQMLDELKNLPENVQMAPLVARDGRGNNALQEIIRIIVTRSTPSPTKRELAKKIVATLRQFPSSFKLLTQENEKGETALTEALKCPTNQYAQYGNTLLMDLMDYITAECQIEGIQKKRSKCSSDGCKSPGKLGHVAECTVGYNLLMSALTLDDKDKENIRHIIDIVCNADDDTIILKLVISHGDTHVPNSIRVAAKKEQWEALEDLVKRVASIDTINLADMLIEEDERLESAMKWIVRAEGTAVKALLKLSNFKLRKHLNDAFHSNYDRNEFMKLEMSVESIKAFYDVDLFVDSFLLPKPSRDKRLSQPHAMICYNTFADSPAPKLKGTQRGAEAIQEALDSLGWEIKKGDIISAWSFTTLKKTITDRLKKCKCRASIFLLCITTHGKDNHIIGEIDKEKTDFGPINEIVRIVREGTETSIPKVVIIDTCRKKANPPKDENIVLAEDNMLLLLGTGYGRKGKAGLYLGELAEQIKKADGETTLEDMHDEATKKVTDIKYKSCNKQAEDDSANGDDNRDSDCEFCFKYDVDDVQPISKSCQDPQKFSTATKIKLRNWKRESKITCDKERHENIIGCDRCTESVCLDCIDINPKSNVLQHPNVRLLCLACCKKLPKRVA